MKEQRQKVKREHDTKSPEVEEHPRRMETYMKTGCTTTKICIICNINNNRHKEVYIPMNCKRRGWKQNLM
jgi:hypothetical protein